MNVRLVSHSRPTEEFSGHGITDCQELIAYCARVSNPSNQFNTETSERLIRYLIRHQHWSPLEMVSACIEITTTRDIARQILRTLSLEKPDSKTPVIAKPVWPWICATLTTENSQVYGWSGNKMSLEPLEKPTLGLSIMA